MKYLFILAIALAAACGKEESGTTKTPGLTVPTDAPKAALDKAIADTKTLIERKQSDAKALIEKIKTDATKATIYQAEYDQLQKDIADLQAKLDGYVKEAAGK